MTEPHIHGSCDCDSVNRGISAMQITYRVTAELGPKIDQAAMEIDRWKWAEPEYDTDAPSHRGPGPRCIARNEIAPSRATIVYDIVRNWDDKTLAYLAELILRGPGRTESTGVEGDARRIPWRKALAKHGLTSPYLDKWYPEPP